MAEHVQVRRIRLDDGTKAEYDGKLLTITDTSDGGTEILMSGQDDENALVWLLTGYKPRRGQAKGGGKGKRTVTEPATIVPGGES